MINEGKQVIYTSSQHLLTGRIIKPSITAGWYFIEETFSGDMHVVSEANIVQFCSRTTYEHIREILAAKFDTERTVLNTHGSAAGEITKILYTHKEGADE